MTVIVHSKTLDVTDSIREFAHSQVQKLTKYSRKIQGVYVFLDTIRTSRGTNQQANVKVQVAIPGRRVVVMSKAHDLYLAISQAIESAGRSVRKVKERRLQSVRA